MASFSSRRTSPQASLSEGFSAVPTSLTAVSSKDTVIFQITVANTTGGALTLLMQDQQGSPQAFIPTISIAANTMIVISFPEGIKSLGGFKWQAGGAGLTAEVYGFVHA